ISSSNKMGAVQVDGYRLGAFLFVPFTQAPDTKIQSTRAQYIHPPHSPDSFLLTQFHFCAVLCKSVATD
ncbi:hypothetical protein, partial [Serratia marcescens]|uniref:hypothetical protein n=1 Tax=Serratia marcescens TaxID=615 RepID=UPI0027E4DAE1